MLCLCEWVCNELNRRVESIQKSNDPPYRSLPRHVVEEIRVTLKRYPPEGVEKLLAGLDANIHSFARKSDRENKAQIRKDLETVAERASRLDKAIHRMSEQGRWELQAGYRALEQTIGQSERDPNSVRSFARRS